MFPLRSIFLLFFIITAFEEFHTKILQIFLACLASHMTDLLQPDCTVESTLLDDTELCKWQSVKCVLGKWPTWRTIIFCVFIYIFNSLHVSSTSCSSSRETNCVNTTSGSCHSVSVAVSSAGWEWVHFRPAHDTATDTEWQLPEVVLTQLVSPDDEHDVLETCRELKYK